MSRLIKLIILSGFLSCSASAQNTQGIAAVQFYGGGTMGMNKNIVWLPRDVDARMKLLLAAAITTVMQFKMNHPDFLDPPN